jgi:hypothetical protein
MIKKLLKNLLYVSFFIIGILLAEVFVLDLIEHFLFTVIKADLIYIFHAILFLLGFSLCFFSLKKIHV